MKAVCTILGWCTAAAAGGGAGMLLELLALLFATLLESGAGEFLGRSLDLPLASESELLLPVEDGAGDVISMGSPLLGGDILIVGVGIGIMRAPIDSLWGIGFECGKVSVLTAMCAVAMMISRQEGSCMYRRAGVRVDSACYFLKKRKMQREANNKRRRKQTGWLKDGVHKVDVGKESKVGR